MEGAREVEGGDVLGEGWRTEVIYCGLVSGGFFDCGCGEECMDLGSRIYGFVVLEYTRSRT